MTHSLGTAELIVLFAVGFVVVIPILINVIVCLIIQSCFERIPQQFRKQQPGMVWLLLIPCFSLVWNFFVYPKLSQSFKAYFDSINRTDVGDCQESIGLAYSICGACCIVPYLGCLSGIAALVLLILFLIKTNELKNKIPLVS